jgi:PST family polysaccharide transporter
LVQLSNTILPLMTLPYLARVLGSNHFGLLMMAQATMVYLTILTDYGFNLSATKSIATHQNDPRAISRIFGCVMSIKCLLLLIGVGILMCLIEWVPLFNQHRTLFYASYLIVVGNTFLPTFLFQGLEKMSLIAIFNFIAKVAFTGFIFFLIKQPHDYQWVHALWGISYIVVDIMAFGLIFKSLHLSWRRPTISEFKSMLTNSFEYFLSRVAIALYMYINIIVVGIFLSPKSAGTYSAAEKLLFAITTFYAPIIETIYPYISRTKNKSFAKKIVIITSTMNTIGCVAAFFIAPFIIPIIFGYDFEPSIHLFQWMLVIAWLHLPTSMIGYPVLGALGHEKIANRSVIIGAVIHILGLILFAPKFVTPLHFVWLMIASQSVIFSIRCLKLMQINHHSL